MFDHCIIHIGTEKTGTSSIQAMLAANADFYSKQGVRVASELGRGNNRELVTAAQDVGASDDDLRRRQINTKEALDEFRQGVSAKLSAIAAGSPKTHHTLVISSEHFHSRLTTEQRVFRVNQFLAAHCRRFTVICYLRPQHEMATSLYSTAMRVGYADFPLLPEGASEDPYYDYFSLLHRWQSVFGAGAIHPRIYPSTDVCADFVDTLHLPKPKVSPPKENTVLSGSSQAFLREMNKRLPRDLRGNLANLVPPTGNGKPAMPSRSNAEAFFQQFKGSNEAVRRQWFPALHTLFDPDFSKFPEAPRDASISLDDAMDIFATLWGAKQRQVEDLRKKIQR